MEPKYYYDSKEFVVENYNSAKPFASFLPGVAGLYGKPLWAFYVNRGQCMSSFGTRDKSGAIMEFYPANSAYRNTSMEGFRTFIKMGNHCYEPFKARPSTSNRNIKQKMYISPHELRIEEINVEYGLKTEVVYFTVYGESFPGLARVVTLTNLKNKKRDIEVIDGMSKIMPYGMNEWLVKHMSKTIEAWMEVEGLDKKTCFYKLRVNAGDVSKVDFITSGNFYLSVSSKGRRPEMIVDPQVVFGNICDLSYPEAFEEKNFKVSKDQRKKNITPSAFSFSKCKMTGNSEWRLFSLIGYSEDMDQLKGINFKMSQKYFSELREKNLNATLELADSTKVCSGVEIFDAYVRQTSLDNILRGGYPVNIGNRSIYVYNRKHGDLERDYNNFVLESEYFSQGNGNFRDVNQNRRSSVWINPGLARKDIVDFFNLIQLDGYNPLVVEGDVFSITDKNKRNQIVKRLFKGSSEAEGFLSKDFTPGKLMAFLFSQELKKDIEASFVDILENATSEIRAKHHEGYWIDHWTYNMDLIESYLAVYPDNLEVLIFGDKRYRFFDNPHVVSPRSKRYVRTETSELRQYSSVILDQDKQELIEERRFDKFWVRTKNGKGKVYKTTLAVKMCALIVNKLATIDPNGMGLEMESDKPGWCDSLNGLPGIFGSSICELAELLRLIIFLKNSLENSNVKNISVPEEIYDFMCGLNNLLADIKIGTFKYWDLANTLKERYRERTKYGLSGNEKVLKSETINDFLKNATIKCENALSNNKGHKGVPYTYFVNKPILKNGNTPSRFVSRPLPLYLEGPVHLLKLKTNKKDALDLHRAVRNSALYDKQLGMYKINASLEKETLEIGRSRVFTPGWLENESIWIHMEYKYILEILKNGLYDEFYESMYDVLVPFQDAKIYGRSILENVSFIASSVFTDPSARGRGFVARLSGATAEFINMLLLMNMGRDPFKLESGKVVFCPSPVLNKKLFTKADRKINFNFADGKKSVTVPGRSYAFSVFENTLMIYRNKNLKNTYGENPATPKKFTITPLVGEKVILESACLPTKYALMLREKHLKMVTIDLC